MFHIRFHLWETNSSSMHTVIKSNDHSNKLIYSTIVWNGELNLFKIIDDKYGLDCMEFGRCSFRLLEDWTEKLAYVLADYVNPKYRGNEEARKRFTEVSRIVKNRIPGVTKIIPGYDENGNYDAGDNPEIYFHWKNHTNEEYFGGIDHASVGTIDVALSQGIKLREIIFSPTVSIWLDED